MKAVAVTSFVESPQLVDLADPRPGPGEILVAVRYASINPVDWAASTGALTGLAKNRFPLILGFDGVGRVEGLGDGATHFAVGDLVFGQFWGDVLQYGTYAERLTIAERPSFGAVQTIPDGVDPRVAAAVPTTGMTAYGALELLDLRPGDSLLILGATGGVGVLATQLAAQAALSVTATARADAADRIRLLGATKIIDYAAQAIGDALRTTDPEGLDGVLDLVGDPEGVDIAARHVRDGGKVVSVAGGVTGELAAQSRVTATNYLLDDKPARLRWVGERLAAGGLVVPIDREVSLTEAPEAVQAARQGGARGKTVIRVG